MSPFLPRAPRRAAAAGLALLAALGAEAEAQNAGAPFYFPAAPSASSAPAAPAAAPVSAAGAYAAPAPYVAPGTVAVPVPAPTSFGAAATSPGSWRGAVAAEPAYSAPLQSAPVQYAAPQYVPAPTAAPVYNPAPVVQTAPQSQAAPQVISPRPQAAPSGSAGAANIFSPVATVNDRVITRFDVEQRARILAAADESTRVSPASLANEALQSLIADQLKVQAAKAAGIEAGAEAVSRGLAEVAEQNDMTPDGMLAFFQARGVARASVEAQVVSEIVWREYLRARYGARIDPTELEIASAVSADPNLTRDQARSRMISERATLTSRSALQELRRKAVIEMKIN